MKIQGRQNEKKLVSDDWWKTWGNIVSKVFWIKCNTSLDVLFVILYFYFKSETVKWEGISYF